jgi:hypothetical protein
MRFLSTVLLLLFVTGCQSSCDDRSSDAQKTPVEAPKSETPTARILALEKKLADATERGDEIARLGVLKDLIAEKLRQAETDVIALKAQKNEADKAVDAARIHAAQVKLWWFVGIMGVACAALVALAIFVPSVAKWSVRGAVACGATAALAAFISWLLPYLVWIGIALLVAGVASCIVYWRLDAKSRDQVVKAVDDLKDKIPNYREHFNQYIDEDADHHLDRTRERLGLKTKDI